MSPDNQQPAGRNRSVEPPTKSPHGRADGQTRLAGDSSLRPVAEPSRQLLVINTASLRWEHYRAAFHKFWEQRGRTPELYLIEWQDVVAAAGAMRTCRSHGSGAPVDIASLGVCELRVESPARGGNLVDEFLRLACREQDIPCPLDELPPTAHRTGWLASPNLVHWGFLRALRGLEGSLPTSLDVSPFAESIATLFDKNRTAERLRAAGLPCPDWFAPTSESTLDEIVEGCRDRGWRSAYLKLAHGSCASGICMLHVATTEPRGLTTVAEIDGRFYNTRRCRKLSGEALRRVVDFIVSQQATVQQAIPKCEVDGDNFDVRVVVVRGQVVATIFRASSAPMTNLHLGGHRASAEACRATIPVRQWLDGLDACVAAAELFQRPMVGADLMFHRQTGMPYLIELNAFGDFFPRWHDAAGRTIHELQLESTAQRHGYLKQETRSVSEG